MDLLQIGRWISAQWTRSGFYLTSAVFLGQAGRIVFGCCMEFNVLPKGLAKRHEIIHHPDRVFPCVAHVAHVRCSLTRKEAAMLKILHISGEQLAELGEEELSSGQTCMIL